MSLPSKHLQQSTHFAAAEFGSPAQWREHILDHPRMGKVAGKTFLGEVLGLTAMEVSFGSMLPGEAQPFLHAHQQNEELYLILSGTGEMQVDGQRIALSAGTAVRIAPAGLRAWRATGTEAMAYVVIQAKAGSLEQAAARDGIRPEVELRW
jgi:mannose-6-phosphate isomerase-like protein (cupin superfamily)